MNQKNWGLVALVLSAVIFFITVFTSLIDGATFLSRIHTTIIVWNLPLVAIGLIIYSFVVNKDEEEKNNFGWVSVALMSVSLFLSNPTKNAVQDFGSNVGNFVDVAASLIVDESKNVEEYGETMMDAVKDAQDEFFKGKRNSKKYDDDYYDYRY